MAPPTVAPPRMFGSAPHDPVHFDSLMKAFPDASPDHVKTAVAAIPFFTIIMLLVQFGLTYGGQLFTIISDVVTMVSAPGGFTLQNLLTLAGKYGSQVQALIAAILAIFGQVIPVPTPPAP